MYFNGDYLNIRSTDRDMDSYINYCISDNEIKQIKKNAKILIMPYKKSPIESKWDFLCGSKSLYNYFKANLPNPEDIQACSDNEVTDDIQCFEAAEMIAALVISSPFTQIALNLLSSFLYDIVKKDNKPHSFKISNTIVFDKKQNISSFESTYEGTAEEFEKVYTPNLITMIDKMQENKNSDLITVFNIPKI